MVNYNTKIFSLFADILEYPTKELIKTVDQCIKTLSPNYSKASTELQKFQNYFLETIQKRREEIYIGTFELNPISYLYVGHHLFGDSYKRGAFLSKLKERYNSVGITVETEIPDHLPIMLRFLARIAETTEGQILEKECLNPSLQQMLIDLEKSENPYSHVISALLNITSPRASVETMKPKISKKINLGVSR